MALQEIGPIALSDVQAEFGGSYPISLSEYYRGGSYVPDHSTNAGVPTTGPISLSSFYGASKLEVFNITISSNTDRFNLRSKLVSLGWGGSTAVAVVVTVASGVKVYSSVAGTASFDTGSALPAGSTVKIVNLGLIEGRAGDGGTGASGGQLNGYPGSNAINLRMPVSIDNSLGYIYGGGGGGGGVAVYNTSVSPAALVRWVGGGGGQGNAGGTGGATGTTDATGQITSTNGGSGSEAGAGAGGVHHNNTSSYGDTTITGGSGGSWGTAGGDGTVSYTASTETGKGTGGAPGNAVALNGNAVTWIGGNNGTRVIGAVS